MALPSRESTRSFTHGSTTSERDVRDIDCAVVAKVLKVLGGRRIHIALITAVGITWPGMAYAQGKLGGERFVRASGNPHTIVRPGWFAMVVVLSLGSGWRGPGGTVELPRTGPSGQAGIGNP